MDSHRSVSLMELQDLHRKVFHAPFGKPKNVPHLLERLYLLQGDYRHACEYPFLKNAQEIKRLAELLVALLVERARGKDFLVLDFWDRRGCYPSLWDQRKRVLFKKWWGLFRSVKEGQETISLPVEEGYRSLPPISISSPL